MTALLIIYLIIGVVFAVGLVVDIFPSIEHSNLDIAACFIVFVFIALAWPYSIWRGFYSSKDCWMRHVK